MVRMPTAPGTLSELQPQIAEIVQKMSKVPFDDIGRDLRTTLQHASTAIGQLTPDAQKALAEVQRTLARTQTTLDNLDRNVTDPNAPVQRNLEDTLVELQRTSRALRVLADYLQQHPEALLRGKPADAAVPQR
jgi:paraquat-inducible protein B